jgi:hypothetical protein
MDHVLVEFGPFKKMSCLEPACGAGHMSKVLKEYFGEVRSSDAYKYGYGSVRNYLDIPYEANAVDWVITNPPFRLAEDFVQRSFVVANSRLSSYRFYREHWSVPQRKLRQQFAPSTLSASDGEGAARPQGIDSDGLRLARVGEIRKSINTAYLDSTVSQESRASDRLRPGRAQCLNWNAINYPYLPALILAFRDVRGSLHVRSRLPQGFDFRARCQPCPPAAPVLRCRTRPHDARLSVMSMSADRPPG